MRLKLAAALALAALAVALDPALAKSSLGIGSAEVAAQPSGPFAGLLTDIAVYQREFFTSLRHALVSLKSGPSAMPFLVGLSFAYGIFHAAGPGHGKAVISSYMLANEVQLRRGVLLSFASALLQALSALAVVGAGWYLLRGTAISMTEATDALEIASYALIAAFGAWLLLRKLAAGLPRRRPAYPLSFAPAGHASGLSVPHGPRRPIMQRASDGFAAEACTGHDAGCGCGRAHTPDPAGLAGERMTIGSAVSAVVAVGLRPCSGAIVVLTFALLNGLYLGGVLSVLAMAAGTAITVSVIAAAAVFIKGIALKAGGRGRAGAMVAGGVEICGALLLLLLGLALLGGALQA